MQTGIDEPELLDDELERDKYRGVFGLIPKRLSKRRVDSYTLDGTEPTPASSRYTGSITLDRTATLSVIGVNSADEQGSDTYLHLPHRPNNLERPVITPSHTGRTYEDPIDAIYPAR